LRLDSNRLEKCNLYNIRDNIFMSLLMPFCPPPGHYDFSVRCYPQASWSRSLLAANYGVQPQTYLIHV